MGEQKSNKEVLDSLVYLLTSDKVSKEKLLPAFKTFSDQSLELDQALSVLKETPGIEFQNICQQIEQSRLDDAHKFYEQNQNNCIDVDYFSEQLKGLPLSIPKNSQEQGIYSELENSCVLLKDYFALLKKQSSAPIIFTHVEQLSLKKIDFFTEHKQFLSCLNIEDLVAYSWHHASDDLRLELRQLKQESQVLYLQSFEDSLEALKEQRSSFTTSSSKGFLDALRVHIGENDGISEELIKVIFQWPSSEVFSLLKSLWQSSQDKSNLSLLLTMRFGSLSSNKCKDWPLLLDKREGEYLGFVERLNYLSKQYPIRLLYIWCMDHGEVSEKLFDLLKESCLEEAEGNNFYEFIKRYKMDLCIPVNEQNVLLGIKEEKTAKAEGQLESSESLVVPDEREVSKELEVSKASAQKIILKDYLANRDKGKASSRTQNSTESDHFESAKVLDQSSVKKAQATPAKEDLNKRSVWQEHMKPFISENWFMMAGILLFVAGSLILSYFTWDKHWLFRYSLMPGLLASFTMGLAYLGKWIESKSKDFVNSASILRAAAIQLLPINFMTVALMSSDEMVNYKDFLIPVMAAIYLALTYLGLKSWCGAVSKTISPLLPRTLLAINSLVVLAPLAETFGLKGNRVLLLILGLGFYFGFAILTYSCYSFSIKIKQVSHSIERRIIWFFSLMIALSFIQVFLWVHSHIRYLPEIFTYAPLLLMSGGLVLMLERASSGLIHRAKSAQEDESFVGYTLIVLALVMSFSDPVFRIICLFLASYIWYLQSLHRQKHLHYYITISLMSVGFFAISGLEFFKAEYTPVLGVINVISLSLFTYEFRKKKLYGFAKACSQTQVVVLLAIVVLAMVKHTQLESSLLLTSFYLIFSACMFMFRAYRDEQVKWVHLSMFVFALCLPYMGCVDMSKGTLVGNTLVFGLASLSILWLIAVRFSPFYLLKEARSTVLWFYGSLAVVVMFIRISIERHVPVDPEWYKAFMDYSGPLLMTAVLIFASYASRSLIPSFMAAIIAVILFPELKANFRATFDSLGFGSGFGSACSALSMIGISFYLRQSPKLKKLGEGDKFMMTSYFPLRRYDHSLFTLPLIGSSCFLLIKTATLNLIRQEMTVGGVSLKGALALLICSLGAFLLYLYFREKKLTWLFHLAWIYLIIGMCFSVDLLQDTFHWTIACFWSLIILQVMYFLTLKLRQSYGYLDELFVKPLSTTLAGLSHICSVLLIFSFIDRDTAGLTSYLFVFIVGQFLWHLKSREKLHFGISLYLLISAYLIPWSTHSLEPVLLPCLYLSLASLVIHAIISRIEGIYDQYKALFKSFLIMASLFSFIFMFWSLTYVTQVLSLSSGFIFLSPIALVLVYLENESKVALLCSALTLYLYFHYHNIERLLDPTQFSLAVLLFSLVSYGLIQLEARRAKWMDTGHSLILLRSKKSDVLFIPAILICELVAVLHIVFWRNHNEQLTSTYVSSITLCFIAWAWKRVGVGVFTVITLSLANIHLIRCFGKNYLHEQGLSEIHLLCLGLGLSLLMTDFVRKYSPHALIKSLLAHSGLVLSLLVLVFLVGNYMSHPNLNSVSPFRFFVSGAMALLAAFYFRNASRKPQDGEEQYVDIFEGIYHFGLSMTFWCITLMIPFMRSPQTAILAFGLPAIYFYGMAEWYNSREKNCRIYRNSASLLLLVLFLLYIFKGVVHLTFYPELLMDNSYYHSNAPILVIYGLLLFRLHALGGRIQLPLYGGFALVLGVFFTLTSASTFSPFDYPIKASYVAIINAHVWILLNYQRSPLRTFFMTWSKLDEEQWSSLRKTWGIYLCVLTQIIGFVALLDTRGQSYLFAPILIMSASVVGHLSFLRRSKTYALLALLEVLFAIHSGFIMDSYLKADDVIYLILGTWAIYTFVSLYKYNNVPSRRTWPVALFFILLLIPHLIYHEIYSFKSLMVTSLMLALSLLTTYSRENIKHSLEKLIPLVYLCIPVYLAYFSSYDENQPSILIFQKNPLPSTLFALFMVAIFVRYLGSQSVNLVDKLLGLRYKIINLVHLYWREKSSEISFIIFCLLSVLTSILLLIFRDEAFNQKHSHPIKITKL